MGCQAVGSGGDSEGGEDGRQTATATGKAPWVTTAAQHSNSRLRSDAAHCAARRALNAVQAVRRSRRGLAQVSRSGVAGVRSGGQPPAAGQWREGLGGSGQGDGGSGGCGLCGEGGDGSLGRRRWIQRQPATETITLPVTCKSSAAR